MRTEAQTNVQRWIKPAAPEEQPEAGYEEWLAADIAAGIAELDAGKFVTLDQVKREFGLE